MAAAVVMPNVVLIAKRDKEEEVTGVAVEEKMLHFQHLYGTCEI